MLRRIFLLFGLSLFLALSGVVRAQDSSIPIYVFSAPSPSESTGFVDPNTERADKEFKQRNDSVRDIKSALEGKKGIRVVESPAEAVVKVEVAWRSSFSMKINVLNPVPSPPIIIRARLIVDDYSLDIAGDPSPIRPGWKGAAKDVANQVEEWVKKNRNRLRSRSD